jgi:hypothetical protein
VQPDIELINSLGADAMRLRILDNSGDITQWDVDGEYEDGSTFQVYGVGDVLNWSITKKVDNAVITFLSDSGAPDVVILEVSYFKSGAVVGSSLVQAGSCELKLLKYKVELPRGAKVTLFDDDSIEAQFLSWNIPCPTSFPNMTFLQVKAANGREAQINASAGSQTMELYQELGRRYAVFGEIWTYSFAQTLWIASLRIQKSDYEWQDCIPTAGEGGSIVTALPQ